MLKLLLVRHGEAPKKLGQTDFARELDDIGIAEANQVKKHLDIAVDKIFSSNAPRAIRTAEIIFEHSDVTYLAELYNAEDQTILALLRGLDNNYKTVSIVGHNPGITSITTNFNLEISAPLYAEALNYHPTCKIVHLSFDTDTWDNVLDAPCSISQVFIPVQN